MKNTIILYIKPIDKTSFQSLSHIKKDYQTKKVGHCGTLDKFAQGLLIVCIGKMTKFVPYFTGLSKTYEACIYFGQETDTLDPEGTVIHCDDRKPDYDEIMQSIEQNFTGKILQSPPIYSALHINGKRAYEYARSGEEIEMKKREIEIFSFEIINYNYPFLNVKIHCSKGTYIRSIARDLAHTLNTYAHLKDLKRTSIDHFLLGDLQAGQYKELDFNHICKDLNITQFFMQENNLVKDIKQGKDINKMPFINQLTLGKTALFYENVFIALINKTHEKISYEFVV